MNIDLGALSYQIMPAVPCEHLDALLTDEAGRVRAVDAAVLHALDPAELRMWAHRNAVYQFATTELVDWLRDQIGGRRAIEIGAGHGAIGRALGIPTTDAKLQDLAGMKAAYRKMGQAPIRYPADVERLDAREAIRRHKPEVVVAAWVTQRFRPGEAHGLVGGVDEERIIQDVDTYLLIGNEKIHGDKRIMSTPHVTYVFPWNVSRASSPELNRIYRWERAR